MSRGTKITLTALFLLAFSCPVQGQGSDATVATTSCLACHGSSDWFDEETVARIVGGFQGGAHAAADLSCQDCHGGDPDPALAEDPDAAMDPKFAANPFRGKPARKDIPAFCGRCHSDPAFMRRYQPDPRVDQEREYWTSKHGKLLTTGDAKVAVCIDCHGTHGILGPEAAGSPVHPTKVAETCSRCHGDPKYMAGYKTDDGRPLPVDQYARWRESVHAAAMFEKEDLTAPTCNDCHGNHGAAPPGLDSIAFVCGQCHGREAELFRASPKRAGFETHNEYLESAGPEGCASCHEAPEPQASLTGVHSFSECATCHGQHAVVRPTIAMLAPLPSIPCAFCHEGGGPVGAPEGAPAAQGEPAESQKVQRHYEAVREALLATAVENGLEGEELFDWMVDRALEVPDHNQPGAEGGQPSLRPEFDRLFQKFRIGKTHFTYRDPATGEEAQGRVRRCSDCHGPEPVMASDAVGYRVSSTFLQSMRDLTSLTARAERITLAAERGGVLVEDASLAVDHAVDAQIQQEVLVHTFDSAENSKFLDQHDAGMKQARTALEEAQGALDELAYRRKGLAVTLVLIVLVLIGLALKIRQLGPP